MRNENPNSCDRDLPVQHWHISTQHEQQRCENCITVFREVRVNSVQPRYNVSWFHLLLGHIRINNWPELNLELITNCMGPVIPVSSLC